MLTFHIVTLFPEALESYLSSSIIGRALREKKIAVKFYNPRDFASPPKGKKKDAWFYRQVDDKSYGGGPGMVMRAEPVLKAVEKALGRTHGGPRRSHIYFFDASGAQFTNAMARKLARQFTRHPTSSKVAVAVAAAAAGRTDVVLICGRYEGIDARVQKILKAKKISVGPYTLTGGELPAMLVMDATARQVPGVLGKFESVEEERVASPEVYTRPEVLGWKGKHYRVPKVLLSGDHKKIEQWRSRYARRGDVRA